MVWGKYQSIVLIVVSFGGSYSVPASDDWGWQFSRSVRFQITHEEFRLADSLANPGNQFAELPSRVVRGELRPDLSLFNDMYDVRVGPRVRCTRSQTITQRSTQPREADCDLFVNEMRIAISGLESWDFWLGREALTWGPALSLTPSNPFFSDTGRSSPYTELGGRDFVAGSWLGPNGVTISYYDNVGLGRADPGPLNQQSDDRRQAVKIDRSGASTYWSVNYAKRDKQPDHIGGFFQTTLGDAWLSYGDVGINFGKTQLVGSQGTDGIWRFVKPDTKRISGTGVFGASYTTLSGSTLHLEYLYNSQGWSKSQSEHLSDVLKQAGERLQDGAMDAAQTLASVAQLGSALRNRHYLFSQYMNRDVLEGLDLIVQAKLNLDDESTRWIVNVEWTQDTLTLFGLGMINTGEDDTEAGQYIENQLILGARILF